MENVTAGPIVLWSRDADVVSAVQAAAAAAGAQIDLVTEAEGLAARWRSATVVLIGADVGESAIRCALPQRRDLYLIATDDHGRAQACQSSVPLGASVIAMPEGGRWLLEVCAGRRSTPQARLVAVLGGSGGVGASTLALSLACAAADPGGAALVDVDSLGGGIDLLLGAERAPGWRWGRLRGARGHVGDLTGQIPSVDGVHLVSMARVGATAPGRDAVAAVLGGLARAVDTIVLDIGRCLDAGAREAVRSADRTVLVCAQDVRGVAAARMTLAAADVRAAGVVVRERRASSIALADVAEALDLPLFGKIADDSRLAVAAERGVSPMKVGGRHWRVACTELLARLREGSAA